MRLKSDPNVETNIFKLIDSRRSIRKFTDKPIPQEILDSILHAGIRAPFAAQLYSIVYTRNKDKMKALRIGVYSSTPVLLIFCIDFQKIEAIVKSRGYTYDYDDGMLMWLAIQDASLVAENVILASEAYSLGSVLLGAAPLQADKIKAEFKLPDRVFPVIGLCLGYPEPETYKETDIRPRFPMKYTIFEDEYQRLTEEGLTECMRAMDDGYLTQGYYMKLKAKVPLQKGEDKFGWDKYSWSEHQSRKYSQGLWSDEKLLTILKRFGLNLE